MYFFRWMYFIQMNVFFQMDVQSSQYDSIVKKDGKTNEFIDRLA